MSKNRFIDAIWQPLLKQNLNQKIYGFWDVVCKYNPNGERCFNYNFLILKTKHQGVAYYTDKLSHQDVAFIVGNRVSEVKIKHTGLQLALIDSLASKRKPDEIITLHGDSLQKSIRRAEIIADYANKLLAETSGDKEIDFLNVGVVTLIMKKLADKGYIVKGCDFDETIINNGKHMLPIYSGQQTLDLIKHSKVAIVTGMTMTNGTIIDIVRVAKENKTKIIMFNETGASLTTYLFDLGVDIVIAEPFPFYIYDDITKIEVHINKVMRKD